MTVNQSVEFLNDGAEAAYRPGNGNTIHYRRHNGIYFHADTPLAVIHAICTARQSRIRIRLSYGDAATGRDWLEEHDVEGTIGHSLGPLKVPLLIHSRRSSGGPALLDHCIVKIKETRSGRVLFKHPKYHTGSFTIREIGPDEMCGSENLRECGYSHAVDVDGRNHANFRSLKAAERFVRKMFE
jgi:hypothetical protein